MSDFEGVDWLETSSKPVTPAREVAPKGVYDSKVIAAEKYKSQKGNWTVKVVFEIENGKYRDHIEYYNLWSNNEESKRISNEMFTALAKATGFKQFPSSIDSLINKTLQLGIYNKDEEWTNDDGETVTSTKTKISEYMRNASSPPASGVSKTIKKSPPTL